MANTYEPIATTTLGSTAASYTFSSIPATYTDLILVAVSANNSAATNFTIQINGDTASNYSRTFLNGNGTSATSGRNSTESRIFFGDVGDPTIPSVNTIHFMNYSNATTFKTVVGRYGETNIQTGAVVGLWRKTPEAITSITLNSASNFFAIGSTFSLYGIKAA
jgi:hypothetical protein